MRPEAALSPHLLQRAGPRLVEHVVEEDELSGAGGHPHDAAERDVDAAVRPGLAHRLQHPEHLGEVERLVPGDDVQRAVEVEALPAVLRRGEVAGGVERAPVRLLEEDGRLALRVREVDDQRPVALAHAHRPADLLDDPLHPVLVEALPVDVLEADAQPLVDGEEAPERRLAELGPERPGLGVSLLHPPEEGAGLGVEGGVRLGAGVGLHVHVDQVAHLAPARRVAVLAEPHRDQAELLPPVAEVVDAFHPPALAPVQVGDGVADERGSQMMEPDGLGDVRRRVVDDHRLAAAGVGRPVAGARPARLGEHAAHEGPGLEPRVDVRPGGDDLQSRDGEAAGEVGGDLRRRGPELLGEREGREGEVRVFRLGGLHLGADGVHRLPEGGGERGGEGLEEPVVEELGHRTERTGRTTEATVSSNFGR